MSDSLGIRELGTVCELRQWAHENGYGPCGGGLTHEHIIPKSKFRGNKEGLKLAYDVYGDYIYGETCLFHNATTKAADTNGAILFLMRKRLREHPEVFPLVIEELAATFKAPPEYFRLEYLSTN